MYSTPLQSRAQQSLGRLQKGVRHPWINHSTGTHKRGHIVWTGNPRLHASKYLVSGNTAGTTTATATINTTTPSLARHWVEGASRKEEEESERDITLQPRRVELLHRVASVLGQKEPACLSAHNQEHENRCVASAFCTAMHIRALLQASPTTAALLGHVDYAPSPHYAYDMCRVVESETTQRVQCGSTHGGMCEDAGSVLEIMRTFVCMRGIVVFKAFTKNCAMSESRRAQGRSDMFLTNVPFYRLEPQGFRSCNLSAGGSKVFRWCMEMLDQGYPIVINMLQYKSFQKFWRRVTKRSQLHEAAKQAAAHSHYHAHAHSTTTTTTTTGTSAKPLPASSFRGAYDKELLLPTATMFEMPLHMGHAMVIVGADWKTKTLRVRNSHGAAWGFQGDFCIGKAHLNPQYITALVAITTVTVHNVHDVPSTATRTTTTKTATIPTKPV